MRCGSNGVKICLLGVAATVALGLGGSAGSAGGAVRVTGASAYPWPLAPFDRAHPVRAVAGDPRTLFLDRASRRPLGSRGEFSLHDGVDIDARNGTPVYAVASGFVGELLDDGVLVQADDGRQFMYRHIVPAVGAGARVTARQTVLGRVRNWADELHFSEYTSSRAVVNPLQPGHLTPYADTTTPTVAPLHLWSEDGDQLAPYGLRGRIALVAEAYDTPMPVAPRGSQARLSKFARDRFPVAPAVVTWSLSVLGGHVVVPPTTVVDFRHSIPVHESLWSIYARGTYQNRSVIGGRMHGLMPGRYLFKLTRSPLDTRKLANGVYVVAVTATDVAGNRSSLSERVEIWNARNAR